MERGGLASRHEQHDMEVHGLGRTQIYFKPMNSSSLNLFFTSNLLPRVASLQTAFLLKVTGISHILQHQYFQKSLYRAICHIKLLPS